MANLIGPRQHRPGRTEPLGYYVANHTWTSTPGAPQLSVDELYHALEEMDQVYPQPSERRDH
ncbi:hypothetical protein [Saccharothrix coeruleofusca]|uniref:Uncharacterized protein n=1 Tax=Saccharothrix coeruleofusca TaxID=33919 RepID=A0A918AN81_9PSEU|nr:hypothetical protein [Saccharothrix coeruleofusca]MBP2338005.1 hypothetical protein [Saccharothrix coeruleofusca]GGP63692.1 hypothetical protein GCM10010185_40500 [Saccharothrix coeruleofusca]